MLLEERFGQPFTIAYEHVTKLTHGTPLRATDRKGLLAFDDQLKSCEHTLESFGYLDEINSADNLRRIVMRLPFHLRTKFVEVADQIQQSGQRPNISPIAEFVKVKARAANNPVFGCLMDTERERTDNLRRRPRTRKPLFPNERERENSPRFGTEISLTVEPLDGTDKIEVNRLWTVDRLNASSRSIPSELYAKQWPHLADINLPSIEEREVRLIIGTNTPEAFLVLEERRGNKGEPYAIRTPLGWALMSPMTNVQDDLHHLTVSFVRSSEVMEDTQDLLMQQVERFWATETIGVETESKACMSLEDKKALRTMEQSVKLQDGHYQVALPWREFPPFLPYNRPLAERRLLMLKRRFLQDNELFKNYKDTMEKYLADGHARRVPPEELHVKDRPLWYLPHHHVLNKPEKTRVVFDCAAKYRGTSLNDQLLTGPNLTNSVLGVLTRFREDRVALSADIECMFHQIRVPPADRDAFRFLWWPTGDLNQEAVDHRMEVHLFGATSSPSCSSFALRKTAEDNKEDFDEEVVKTDDCLKSVKSVDCAIQIVVQLRDLLSKGEFRLIKWLSNNSKVLNFIPHEERAPSLLDLDLDKDKPPIQRALGLHWNMETDMFTFKVNLKEKPDSRRGILSLASSLYDPLGLVAPIILPAKKLLQDLCKQKLGWDDPINDDDKERWEKWKNQLSGLPKIKVNRCLGRLALEN
ncbi:uncharacterized protein [Montipora capricornis]|uniref:uncharacterized protein n=1 Tax=Montipora capricornis TaxID=246305 RepID=UPI0035F13364